MNMTSRHVYKDVGNLPYLYPLRAFQFYTNFHCLLFINCRGLSLRCTAFKLNWSPHFSFLFEGMNYYKSQNLLSVFQPKRP